MDNPLPPEEWRQLSEKYPGRIPVYVSRGKRSDASLPALRKARFLVPKDLCIGQFIYIIRRQLQLPPEKALFLFIGNVLPTTSSLMREMYSMYKSDDGVLRMTYMSENTFGGTGLRMAFYTTPEIEKVWNAHYVRMEQRAYEKVSEVRVFDVREDGVYNGGMICPETQVENGGIYKLEPHFLRRIAQFQGSHQTYRVIFELHTNYCSEECVMPATIEAGEVKLRVEDICNYNYC
jgi:GABA(A) receptor-associated protein